MKNTYRFIKSISPLIIPLFLCMFIATSAKAATRDIEVHNNDNIQETVYVGDTGKLIPVADTAPDNPYIPSISGDATKEQETITYRFSTWNPEIATVDYNTGEFSAIAAGSTTIYVSGINQYGFNVFSATVNLTVTVDMTNATVSTDTLVGYMSPYYYYKSKKPTYSNGVDFTINLLNTAPITLDDGDDNFQYMSTNATISLEASIDENVINIHAYGKNGGTTVMLLTIYGKQFNINISLVPLKISNQSYMLPKKKSVKLTISGYEGPIEWTSSNPKVATVDANGVVKGKTIGNTLIKAKVGDVYLGCIVSVTTSKLKKVVERACFMGTHWEYSQAKRTQKGYYDCSALVWKAYTQYTNINFGSRGYPGVALSEAKWCKSHGKMIKGGITYKKLNKLQVNPGDLLFKSSDLKHPYNDIYHVEMFTGYYCHGVNSAGIASISPCWAARENYYPFEEKSLLGRPIK